MSAQVDSSWNQKPQINILGFADVFYVYDFNRPSSTERQPFLFNHNRHNEFNLNLGLVKFSVEHMKYRANFALQSGTYANDNYAAEPGVLKNIFEANIGISLNKENNLWLDVGVLPSHIGFESAISMDNLTLTRSLLAENSPYFLTGAKLTFNPNNKWEIAGLVVNGWQRIQRLEGNSLPSFGSQVTYSPSEKISLNWSTFLGTDDSDSTRRMRYFNDFYGLFQLTEKINLITAFDLGFQQNEKESSDYNLWFSPIIIGQYVINKTWRAAIRAEYYQDKSGVIIPTNTINGFLTKGISLNLDYSPVQNITCRLEGRMLRSKDKIFETNTAFSDTNFFVATSIAFRLSDTFYK
ncbi:porin [Algoriphagus lutimaris]|uniref:porin n=1 Tax=Algoriphagus lutimaris TaxID=613197 RepID=UPI001FAFDA1B|nr:porin [Algoriphagus lutimaris]